MFGPRKCVESMYYTSGLSVATSNTPPLISSGCGGGRPWAHELVTEAVFSIQCVRYFSILQDHEVIITQLYRPYYLRKSKAAAVSDIIHPEVHPGGVGVGVGQTASRLRKCHVNPVTDMAKWARESDWDYSNSCHTNSWEPKPPEVWSVLLTLERTDRRSPCGAKLWSRTMKMPIWSLEWQHLAAGLVWVWVSTVIPVRGCTCRVKQRKRMRRKG